LLYAALLPVVWSAPPAFGDEWNAALNSIQPLEIRAHIDVLADDALEGREAGSRGGRAAAQYLQEQLQAFGLQGAGDQGAYFQDFDRGRYRNVLGLLEGSDPVLRSEYVLVSAHYDHVGYGTRKNSRGPIGYVHNGADDNASGVSGLLEVAQAFQTFGPPRRSLVFALWDGEEKGMLGSKHWAAHPTVPTEQIVLGVNLDMIGRLRDQRLNVFGTRSAVGLRRLVCLNNQLTDLVLEFTWELKANSDHYALFTRDVPVLMLHTGLHDDYHRPSDDADKINHDGASQVTRLLFSVLAELADRPHRVAFRPAARFENDADRDDLQRPAPPRPPRLGASWRKMAGDRPGIYLTAVRAGSPAAAADLRPGDRVLRFADRPVDDEWQLRRDILSAGSPAPLAVQRGEHETVEVLVELAGGPLRFGVSWREDSAEPGVVVFSEVVPGSAAEQAGLEVGDRLYRFAGEDFADSDHLLQRVADSSGPVELLVERTGRIRTFQLDLPPLPSP
jgi:hypothetical protein